MDEVAARPEAAGAAATVGATEDGDCPAGSAAVCRLSQGQCWAAVICLILCRDEPSRDV